MVRKLFRWQLKDESTDTVVADGVRFARNAAIRAGEDALRDVPGRGMFERDGCAVVTPLAPGTFTVLGDKYAQRWSGPRGTFTVKVVCIRTV